MLDRVVLGPHTFAVEFVDDIPGGSKKKPLLGLADTTSNILYTAKGQSESGRRSTLIHEVLHAAYWMSAVRFVDGWTDEIEEAAITAVEGYLLELFTRLENEPVRDYLTGS